MIYEIINPSDPYTLETDSYEAASVACMMLGRGQYGLRAEDSNFDVPIMLFGGAEEFTKKKFGKTVSELMDGVSALQLAEVLDSVLIGNIKDRAEFKLAAETMTTGELAKFLVKRHDLRRSSMNDIGGLARSYAKQLCAKETA